MVKAEVMAYLLAHNQPAPRWRVVGSRIEIRVVDFRDGFGDVQTGNPDLGDA